MPDSFRDQGAIPQGLLAQAKAKAVDPSRLQFFGKQAAALYRENQTKLSEAVVQVLGDEQLGPEHTKRVCEFANQAAYQNAWEKSGSVKNIEFEGGPADAAEVLRELNDGASSSTKTAAVLVSDYDRPPVGSFEKTASAGSCGVEDEIFAGHTDPNPHPTEVPSGLADLHRLRIKIAGANDHVTSKISGLEITKEALALELGDEVKKAVMTGDNLGKVASAWAHYAEPHFLKEAIKLAADRLVREKLYTYDDAVRSFDKVAAARVPNPEHPVISRFIEFQKVAKTLDELRGASTVLREREEQANDALKSAIQGGSR